MRMEAALLARVSPAPTRASADSHAADIHMQPMHRYSDIQECSDRHDTFWKTAMVNRKGGHELRWVRVEARFYMRNRCLRQSEIRCKRYRPRTLAGIPATLKPSCTSSRTTEPAPTVHCLPTRTPCTIVAPEPIWVSSPMTTSPESVTPGAK